MYEVSDDDVFVFLPILEHAHVITLLLTHYRKVTALVLGQYASRRGNSITIGHRLHYCKQFSKAAFCVQIHNKFNNKYRTDNGTGLTINYVDHKVQLKDTHWTGTIRVQAEGPDKEQPEKEQGMGTANGWKKLERGIRTSLRWIQMEGFYEGPLFHTGTKGQTYDYTWHISTVTFRHLFYRGTNTGIAARNKSVSSVRSKVTACFTSTSVAKHLPVKCFMRGPQSWKSLGARTGLKEG